MPPKKPSDPTGPNERNEYIPSFIAKKPFYITDDQATDYLEHQRLQSQQSTASQWYDRGKRAGPAATKYRKGACENCGAMTHKAKDCLSRPRKHGAKWTGRDIQADEVVQDVSMGWDAKRDRWNGYDAGEYQAVVEEFNELEEMKRRAKGAGADGEAEAEVDEGDRYEAETDMGRKQSTATRQLRLREDTAKYLLNLDLDSAKYDPKTRSMVDSGGIGEGDKGAELMAEEGFVKASGDAAEFEKAQKYAWETQERGDKNKLHLQANPTAGQLFMKKEKEEAEKRRTAQKKALAEKYGTQEQFQSLALKDAAVTENEKFVEYDERGRIKGQPEKEAKSKYPEDVYLHNHTSVWGSWWHDFVWGYACCHSTVKNSYCTGETGKAAFSADRLREAAEEEEEEAGNDAREVPREVAWREEEAREEHVPNAVEKDTRETREEQAKKRAFGEMMSDKDEREMDEWRKKRVAADDPMAKMLGRDELVR